VKNLLKPLIYGGFGCKISVGEYVCFGLQNLWRVFDSLTPCHMIKRLLWKFCVIFVSAVLFVANFFIPPHTNEVVNAKTFDNSVGEAFIKDSTAVMARHRHRRGNGGDYTTMQLIVQTDNGQKLKNTYGAIEVVFDPSGLHLLQFETEKATKEAHFKISKEPNIEYIEPNRVVSLGGLEIQVTAQFGWGTQRIYADGMKNYLVANNKISNDLVVAVIDSGVDYNHPFIKNRIVSGRDFIQNDLDPMDEHGHGTHVSGTIVDCTTSNVKIMPVRVMDSTGQGSDLGVSNGIRWAADNGAKVINMSLAGEGVSYSQSSAVNYAVSKGACVVVAAGNDNADTKNYVPAKYTNVITVAATDKYDTRAWFSNFGDAVDIAAPGIGIYSTYLNNSYATMQGTSMATPHVTAAVALLRLDNVSATPSNLKTLVCASTKDVGAVGKDIYYGHGVLDLSIYLKSINQSVTQNAQTPRITAQPQDMSVGLGGVATLSVAANVTDGGVLSYQWYESGSVVGNATSSTFTPITTVAGSYYYSVVVTNTNDGVSGVKTASMSSEVATFVVNTEAETGAEMPTIHLHPDNVAVVVNAVVVLTVEASIHDGGTLSYQWYMNIEDMVWQIVEGATESMYSPSTTFIETRHYYCAVTNSKGGSTATLRSDIATVIVNAVIVRDAQIPEITTQPISVTAFVGEEVKLFVAATVQDGGTLSYQWYGNGIIIDNATSAEYLPDTKMAGIISFYVVVTNKNDAVYGVKTVSIASERVSVNIKEAENVVSGDDEKSIWDNKAVRVVFIVLFVLFDVALIVIVFLGIRSIRKIRI